MLTAPPAIQTKKEDADKQPKPFNSTKTGAIDVAILTMNSEQMLKECINSVYENVPINNLIIVDGFSTDATMDIIKEFQQKYGNVTFVQEKGTRGSARQTAIEKVKSDWFMFVDSDVTLSKNWFAEAEKFVKDDVGAVWGIEIWSVLRGMKILSLFERVTLKIFEKRGGTHDLLIRRKTVDDIKIPFKLHTYEDGYIKDWIEQKGFKVLGVYEPYCVHFRSDGVWTFRKHVEFMVSDLKYAVHRPKLLLSYAFYSAIVFYQIVSSKTSRKK
ncbi:MAG TPA: glycosyltransferase family A protein [Candidatus Binatia bacterium]|nr:glycosyltransferase family A protein [Candidatus Binatia bacterium]